MAMAVAMAMAGYKSWVVAVLGLVLGLLLCCQRGFALQLPVSSTFSNFRQGENVKSRTYLSNPFTLGPGQVADKVCDMEFPTGHIAFKGLDAELVDEEGNSVPLTDVYLHHWLVARYYTDRSDTKTSNTSRIYLRNDGLCQDHALDQIIGLGSETRHSNYAIPDPYGIVVGDPHLVPEGFRELWALNVHAIDTRSAVDAKGCLECRCTSYGVDMSTFKYRSIVGPNYNGGLYCCPDGSQCAVTEGASLLGKKTFFLKYTVHWVDWNPSVVPVRTYILDLTDDGKRDDNDPRAGCRVEYEVPACDKSLPSASCVHYAEGILPALPKGGYVVYSIAHQHVGGMGCTLYGDDGREICTSEPFYGTGTAAGDEAGYVVGMGSCYPQPGSVKVYDDEKLRLSCRYSSLSTHTGVMGLQYMLVADFDESEGLGINKQLGASQPAVTQDTLVSAYVTTIFGLAGMVAACGVIVVSLVLVKRRRQLDSKLPTSSSEDNSGIRRAATTTDYNEDFVTFRPSGLGTVLVSPRLYATPF